MENYIPDTLTSKYNFLTVNLQKEKVVEVANGSTVLISKKCNLQFEILHDKNITYKANFLVLPNLTEILILGMRFLLDNDAVINLKEGSIILDGMDYEICSSSIKGNPYDDELIAKSKICTIHDDITQLIKTAKSNNPVLGSIDVAEHKIELHSEFRPPI
ncbi:hypothetical protein EQH57_0182 [Dictyocoela roeselum]|nr:hypothetical protein EQH57_0182 [Dictyocoela roeselum]